MKKNDLIDITITDQSVTGEGIGKYRGFPFFVLGRRKPKNIFL